MSEKQLCNIENCGKGALMGLNLCREHHTEKKYDEWLNNTDPNNLGIVKWITELMPEFATQASPQFHIELYNDLLALYNPDYVNKYERLYEFICFREGAKSTAANTLFVSYILANNGKKIKYKIDGEIREFVIKEDTVVIISQTAGSAEEFTVRIRDAFATNKRLRYYYNVEIEKAVDETTNQWTRSAFKLNKCYVQGIGSGQMIRGKVKGTSRPTLVIADDIYSEGTVKTEESRQKTKAWWNNAVMNSIDNLKGKVIMLGTIVHDDTVLVEARKNPQWQTKEIPLMDVDLFEEFIHKHIEVDWDTASCRLPYSEIEDRNERFNKQKRHFNAIQNEKDWKLSWPERIDLYFIAIKFQEAVYNQSVSGMYQEYFHITKSPYDKVFRRDFFLHTKEWEIKYENNNTYLQVGSDDTFHRCDVHFGIDLSGTGADDAVISVIATLGNGKIYVLQQSIGKWSLRDDVPETEKDLRYGKVVIDRSKVRKVGIIDECFRLAKRYHPIRIKVGVAGEEEMVVGLMRQVFSENRDYTYIVSRKQTTKDGRKEDRIYHTLAPYYETRMVYHANNLSKLEYQLEFLGASDHDDCADSLECAFYGITYPSDEVWQDEEPRENDSDFEIEDDWWITV